MQSFQAELVNKAGDAALTLGIMTASDDEHEDEELCFQDLFFQLFVAAKYLASLGCKKVSYLKCKHLHVQKGISQTVESYSYRGVSLIQC